IGHPTAPHTAAMRLLHASVDIATIALWLGHESIETTGIYLHALCRPLDYADLCCARSAFPGWQGVFDLVWGVVLGIVAV
ncbi:MAG: tyrosine-type recombinase/integrase, partial [Candidatus Microthrix parvicella]